MAVDLAKDVFELALADRAHRVIDRKRLTRRQFESFVEGLSVGTKVVMEAKQGAYTLNQPAPIPEWQTLGDPRAKIRIMDILHMSSGLRIIAPHFDERGPYPDHLDLYTGSVDSFKYAATRPQQWPPNTVGRYRNTDPVLTNT